MSKLQVAYSLLLLPTKNYHQSHRCLKDLGFLPFVRDGLLNNIFQKCIYTVLYLHQHILGNFIFCICIAVLYLSKCFKNRSPCKILQVTKKLGGNAAGTASWATNVGNELGQVLSSVLLPLCLDYLHVCLSGIPKTCKDYMQPKGINSLPVGCGVNGKKMLLCI